METDSALNQAITFSYDEFNRLSGRTVTAGQQQNYTYVYDRYGNRWQQNFSGTGSGPQPQLTFNPVNNEATGYSYDAPGNLTNDGSHSYTYDAEGNILQVDGGGTAAYTYDAMNLRVRVQTATANTVFAYNTAGQRVAMWNSTTGAQIQGQFYWGPQSVAYYTTSPAQTQFQHQDWLGTERVRTSYNWGVEGAFSSLPFGDGFAVTSGTDTDAYHFAVLDHDYYDNTDHAQFRNYSPSQGRWLSPDPYDGSYDPSNPQSLNRYAYVLNNSLSYIDPSGLDHGFDCGKFCVGVVGSIGGLPGDGGGGYGGGGYSPSPNLPFRLENGGGGGGAPSNGRQPNKITCGTVLPNGRTVGSYVNQLSNGINSSAQGGASTPYGPGVNPSTPGPISVAGQVYSGTNFKGQDRRGSWSLQCPLR